MLCHCHIIGAGTMDLTPLNGPNRGGLVSLLILKKKQGQTCKKTLKRRVKHAKKPEKEGQTCKNKTWKRWSNVQFDSKMLSVWQLPLELICLFADLLWHVRAARYVSASAFPFS
jgi:hypothetical protein